jgi:hypothetical protein
MDTGQFAQWLELLGRERLTELCDGHFLATDGDASELAGRLVGIGLTVGDLTRQDLQALCAGLGLSVSSSQPELLRRLRAASKSPHREGTPSTSAAAAASAAVAAVSPSAFFSSTPPRGAGVVSGEDELEDAGGRRSSKAGGPTPLNFSPPPVRKTFVLPKPATVTPARPKSSGGSGGGGGGAALFSDNESEGEADDGVGEDDDGDEEEEDGNRSVYHDAAPPSLRRVTNSPYYAAQQQAAQHHMYGRAHAQGYAGMTSNRSGGRKGGACSTVCRMLRAVAALALLAAVVVYLPVVETAGGPLTMQEMMLSELCPLQKPGSELDTVCLWLYDCGLYPRTYLQGSLFPTPNPYLGRALLCWAAALLFVLTIGKTGYLPLTTLLTSLLVHMLLDNIRVHVALAAAVGLCSLLVVSGRTRLPSIFISVGLSLLATAVQSHIVPMLADLFR